MSGRGSRKRAAALSAQGVLPGGGGGGTLSEFEPPTRRSRRDVLSCELETVQAELEHERSLRALDSKRFVHAKQRLEKQVGFAAEEAKESKALMEEMRDEHERHLDQLKRSMDRTKEELRNVQEDLDEERALASRRALEEDPRMNIVEDDLEAKSIENDKLRETVDSLKREMQKILEDRTTATGKQHGGNEDDNNFSEARPEVLKELNKVRVRLAESERRNRQYKRIAEEAQRKSKQFVQEKERLRSANKRIGQLETECREAKRAEESVAEQLRRWQGLGIAMDSVLAPRKSTEKPKSLFPGDADAAAPPDVALIRQYLNDTKTRAAESEASLNNLKQRLETSGGVVRALQTEKAAFGRKEAAWNEERRELEKRQQLHQKDIKVLRAQEDIYRREVESLRSIVKTFDDLPLKPAQGGAAKTEDRLPPANTRVLRVSLAAAREETSVLKEARDRLQDDLNAAIRGKEELWEKHNSVLEKFAKLRDALYAERAKAEEAVERANEAEILAGKGSFNPEHTRVLHMGVNPLTVALKEEVNVLRKQVEVLSNGDNNKKSKTAYSSDVDPNKLHQRLKQSFKEQISRFREGVYLMTGFKVDMIPDNDRYKFKVRSVFAEREKDHLVFQWPEGKEVTSLDLLNTEYAKLLTKSPSYEYMTKFHSLPAFLASIQLTLFETQTMI